MNTRWLALGLVIVACGPARMDLKFTAPNFDEAKFRQARYECMQRHDKTSNFVACMEAVGYTEVK